MLYANHRIFFAGTKMESYKKEFIDFTSQIDKSKLTIQQSLDKLETLKKALMQQLLTGKIRVKVN